MFNKAPKYLLLCALTAALAACGMESQEIQKQYAADRDECREYAEQTTGSDPRMMPTGREHILLVSQFGRCMNKRGWAVNKPPEEVTNEAKKAAPSAPSGGMGGMR